MNHFLLVGLFSTNISNFDTIFLLFLPITERMVLKSPNIIVVCIFLLSVLSVFASNIFKIYFWCTNNIVKSFLMN